ncbi:hypothetical protein L5515_012486 [Caenorhabditis briggsae]|uniref:Uncharacterized protein n=1 Tax=Caenorhabditis briggsae TaxID=6238 RepID=A0AAE9EXQ7_CAEBR|nr:hypothetical protein L5515_012486 [Caenorhabditis briggsae]
MQFKILSILFFFFFFFFLFFTISYARPNEISGVVNTALEFIIQEQELFKELLMEHCQQLSSVSRAMEFGKNENSRKSCKKFSGLLLACLVLRSQMLALSRLAISLSRKSSQFLISRARLALFMRVYFLCESGAVQIFGGVVQGVAGMIPELPIGGAQEPAK